MMPLEQRIQTLVFEAIGEASMCWKPTPEGIFDSTKASDIGDRVMTELHKLLAAYEIAKGVIDGVGPGNLGQWEGVKKELEG